MADRDGDGASRVRSNPDLVAERVGIIENLMRQLLWERGRTSRDLAAKWGVSVAAVNDYAAEAGRRVREAVAQPDEVETTVCSALSTVLRQSMSEGDRKSAIRAADVWSHIVGARAPERLKVSADAITLEQVNEFQTAVVSHLCDGCKAKVLAHMRERKEPAK